MTKRTRVTPTKMFVRPSSHGSFRWMRPQYDPEAAVIETKNKGWDDEAPVVQVMVLDYRDYLALKKAAKGVRRGK